jgi:hypothetical protein
MYGGDRDAFVYTKYNNVNVIERQRETVVRADGRGAIRDRDPMADPCSRATGG